MTALDLISGAMRLIGVLESGESPSSNEANDAFSSLNDMIGTWSTEQLLIYAKTEDVLALVAGQDSYTMGLTGNWNTARPQRIESAFIRTSADLDIPVSIINQEQFLSISTKGTGSSIPTMLFAQGTYPLETIYLFPVPSDASNHIVIWSWKPLSSITSLASTISLPPGYSRALRYNLALELAPEYGKQLDPVMLVQAVEAKAAIKRMNVKPLLMSTDPTGTEHTSSFNWLTGE